MVVSINMPLIIPPKPLMEAILVGLPVEKLN